jgi:magnesium transporter
MDARKQTQHTLQLLREQLNSGSLRSATRMMQGLHPSEVAHLLESVPPDERAILWEMVDAADEGDILVELADEVSDSLIRGMHTERLIAATEGMEVDDLADLLADLPEAVAQQVLQSLDDHDRERIRQVLAYDEDSAGGQMNVDIVTVRPNVSMDVV